MRSVMVSTVVVSTGFTARSEVPRLEPSRLRDEGFQHRAGARHPDATLVVTDEHGLAASERLARGTGRDLDRAVEAQDDPRTVAQEHCARSARAEPGDGKRELVDRLGPGAPGAVLLGDGPRVV